MATYIFTETEPFSAIAESRSTYTNLANMVQEVRRPVRGLQVSKDTHAYLQVLTESNQPLDLISSGGLREDENGVGKTSAYTNFLLQRASIARAELKQFVKTFGLTYLFLFGENPVLVNVDGALIHSVDFPWDEEWWTNYENTLRATRTAEMGARVYLYYDRIMIEGYMLNATTNREAEARHLVPLAFTIAATNIKFLPKVGSTQFPVYSTIFDYSKPVNYGGQDINSVLPVGRSLGFESASAFAGVSGGTEGMAVMGSFQQMVRAVADNPWLLVGDVARSSYGLVNEAMRRRSLPPLRKPRYGKIRENLDEYVGEAPLNAEYAPRDSVQTFEEYVSQEQEAGLSGDALRSQLRENGPQLAGQSPFAPPPLSSQSPFEGLSGLLAEYYANGTNLSTAEGLGGSHGVGVVDNDLVADAGGSSDIPLPPETGAVQRGWSRMDALDSQARGMTPTPISTIIGA